MENHSRIIKQVFNGALSIDSVSAFEDTVRCFPDDPSVYRSFADLLVEKKSLDAAARAYRKAARLYLDFGMMLQALVAKILEWRIVQPSHREGQAFFWALKGLKVSDSPLCVFVSKLEYPELMAFMMKLVRVRLAGGKFVQKVGQPLSAAYFVVFGQLRQTPYEVSSTGSYEKKNASIDLMENHFFGDIHPLGGRKLSDSDVETVTRVELVKISGESLKAICRKYPNVEQGLKELSTSRFPSETAMPSRAVRKSARHQLPTKARIKIYSNDPNTAPIKVEGFTEDISLGGANLIVGDRYRTGSADHLFGKKVEIEIDLPKADRTVQVSGTIVWSKDAPGEEKKAAVGVQFGPLSYDDRQALEEYCYGSDGEQNLIWSLWESYVKP